MRARPNLWHECACITKRNGAWLVVIMGDLTDDATPDALYDAARNLYDAKDIARERARAFGYTLHGFERDEHGTLWLRGSYTREGGDDDATA